MNDFSNKICPYCKTKFSDDDDIIVCSECEMPHHKECWIENQGCTTFGCLGTITATNTTTTNVPATDYVPATNYVATEQAPAQPISSDTVFCTFCGARCSSTSVFCSNCGTRRLLNTYVFCTRCGTRCSGTASFCSLCGNKLNG